MYRQMAHGHPLVNGYSGYFPPHYAALRFGLETHDPDMLSQLASHGVKDVIVDREVDRGAWETYVRSYPGAKEVCTEGQQSLYHIEAQEASAAVATAGSPLALSLTRVSINEVRHRRDVRQRPDNPMAVWTAASGHDGRSRVRVPFGRCLAIDLQLGPFAEDFPRGLDHRSVRGLDLVDRDLAWGERRAGVRRRVRIAARGRVEVPVCPGSGSRAANETHRERRHLLLVDCRDEGARAVAWPTLVGSRRKPLLRMDL